MAVLVGLLAATAGPAGAAFAAVAEDAPDVRGQSIEAATAILHKWDKGVTIAFQPQLAELPPGTDPAYLVVADQSTVTPSPIGTAAFVPMVLLTLGAIVPDVTGLSRTQATDLLGPLGLALRAAPAPANWVVQEQRPKTGELASLLEPVVVVLADPAPVTPTATAGPGVPTGTVVPGELVRWLVAGGTSLLVLLLLVTALLVRRASRRRARAGRHVRPGRDGRAGEDGGEAVEVRGFPGDAREPVVTTAGPDVSIAVTGRADDHPVVRVEEVR